jgi:hypothetical protein
VLAVSRESTPLARQEKFLGSIRAWETIPFPPTRNVLDTMCLLSRREMWAGVLVGAEGPRHLGNLERYHPTWNSPVALADVLYCTVTRVTHFAVFIDTIKV